MKYEIEKWLKVLNYKPQESVVAEIEMFFSEERATVRQQFANLRWDVDDQTKNNAMCYLAENLLPSEYIFLVMPDKLDYLRPIDISDEYYEWEEVKAFWEGAAKTIIKVGWPKVENILVPLFVWLLDNNWPGSELIYEFLCTIPQEIFLSKTKEILENQECYSQEDYQDLCDVIKAMNRDTEGRFSCVDKISP